MKKQNNMAQPEMIITVGPLPLRLELAARFMAAKITGGSVHPEVAAQQALIYADALIKEYNKQ